MLCWRGASPASTTVDMRKLLRGWYFFLHLRKSQFVVRLWLTVRRRVAMRLPALSNRRLEAATKVASVTEGVLPPPLFPPRRHHRKDADGRDEIRIIDRWYPFEHPYDWAPEAFHKGTHLELLTLHYMEYLETVDDATFVILIDDWIASNPPFGRAYYLGSWNSFALSIRIVVWLQAIALRRSRLEDAFLDRMAASLTKQMTFLTRNLELDILGNHLIKNIKALLWAGRCLDGPDSARWRALGEKLLRRQLADQILPDGMHFERSPAYHCQVLADLIECYQVMADGPTKTVLADRLGAMARALQQLTLGDGRIANFNDGGLSMAYARADLMAAYARVIGRPPVALPHVSLPSAGYYGCRFDDEIFIADAGRIAPDYLVAHGQGDVFSFVWSKGQRRLIEDAGVFEYDAGRRRAWSRATAAHNTVTLDDRDQADFWGAFRCGRRPSVFDVSAGMDEASGRFQLSGRHDGYAAMAGKPIHERRFDVRAGVIRVNDRVLGGRGQAIVARLLLAPGADVEVSDHQVVARIADVTLTVTSSGRLAARQVEYYPDFGVCETAWQVQIDMGAAPGGGDFTISLSGQGDSP